MGRGFLVTGGPGSDGSQGDKQRVTPLIHWLEEAQSQSPMTAFTSGYLQKVVFSILRVFASPF